MTSLAFLATAILLLHTVRTQQFQRSKRPKTLEKAECVTQHLYGPRGTVSSPGYPKRYSNHTSCTWYITGKKTDYITLSFDDLDIEEDLTCETPPCCDDNWVKIGSKNGKQQKYCGSNIRPPPFIVAATQVWIKFHISRTARGGKGFSLSYIISPQNAVYCREDEFHCLNARCILGQWKCNNLNECGDGSDEFCEEGCAVDEVKCGNTNECYKYKTQRCNRIWDCTNGADEVDCDNCPQSYISCHSGSQCYTVQQRCDGNIDCSDQSDELDCDYCGANKTRCGPQSSQCFDVYTQKCNREVDCQNGEDEKGCRTCQKDEILCSSGQQCYPVAGRCNGIAQCGDYSDEKNCGPELCKSERGGFLCGNGHCIKEIWKCDRTNDCGDGTDEENCLKNSVISAAVMGSLICGLLLVIAISCTCRLYSLRFVEQQVSNRETPLSRLTQEFLYREPPPSYAVATGQHGQNLCVESLHYEIEARNHHRRPRRVRRTRRRSSTPSSPTQNIDQGSAVMQTPSIQSCNFSTFSESSQSCNSLETAVSFISSSENETDVNSTNQRKDEKLDGLLAPVLVEHESTKTSDAQNEPANNGSGLSITSPTMIQGTSDIHIDLNVLSTHHSSENLHSENTIGDHDTQPLITD